MSMEEPWRAPCMTARVEAVLSDDRIEARAGPPRRAVTGDDPRLDLHRRICAYIESNLGDERLGIALLIRRFAVSRSTLCRLFGDEGGVGSYIRRRRLERARSYLMDDPACGITWLLYELGFASDRQFQRAFHARYGISPAQWRKCCRGVPSRSARAGHDAALPCNDDDIGPAEALLLRRNAGCHPQA